MRAQLPGLTLLLLSGILPHLSSAQSLGLMMPGATSGMVSTAVRETQDSLVTEAMRKWHARPARTLPGWREAVRDAERIVGRPWRGLPPVVLLVPDDGHGFPCDGARCLGRFLGARIAVPDGDSTTVTQSSIVLVAESVFMRRDIFVHELTHALLAQYGLFDESARHDRRYFRSDHALDMTGT